MSHQNDKIRYEERIRRRRLTPAFGDDFTFATSLNTITPSSPCILNTSDTLRPLKCLASISLCGIAMTITSLVTGHQIAWSHEVHCTSIDRVGIVQVLDVHAIGILWLA